MKLMCPPPILPTASIGEDKPIAKPDDPHPFVFLMRVSYTFELGVFFGMTVITLLRMARTCKSLRAKVEHHLKSFVNLSTNNTQISTVDMFVYHESASYVSKWLVSNQIDLDMPLFSGRTISQIISRKLSAMRSSLTYVPPTQDEIRYCGLVLRYSRDSIRSPISHNPEILMDLQFKTKSNIKIRLHVCSRSALCGILSLSSTSLMNFVATHSAFSLFPRETINKKVSLSVNATQNNYLRTIQDPFRRWPGQLQDSFYPLDRSCDFPAGPRMFSGRDRTCLRVPLTGDVEELSDYTDNILLESTVYFGYVLSGKGPAYLNFNTWDKYTVRPSALLLRNGKQACDKASSVTVDGDDENTSSSIAEENVEKQPSCAETKESIIQSSNLEDEGHTSASSDPDERVYIAVTRIVDDESLTVTVFDVADNSDSVESSGVDNKHWSSDA